MRAPILVTGGSGQLGQALAARAGDQLVCPLRSELDLANAEQIDAVMRSREWSAVINAGAYTAVDRAEDERDTAFAINAAAPTQLAAIAAALGIPLLHVSTDYVFDGNKAKPYVEDDAFGPISAYGASKLAGETGVRAAGGRHVIVRTAWLQSANGTNFLKTMLRLGAEREALSVVDDQIGCPTSAEDIAQGLLTLSHAMIDAPERAGGTYHFVNSGAASWYELARFLFDQRAAAGHKVPQLNAIPTSAYPTRARRPANSRLATDKLTRDFGIVPRPWQTAITDLVPRLAG